MYLRANRRCKDGKEHRYWSIGENRRVRGGRTVQQSVLYLGEINDAQHASWCRTIELLDGARRVQLALFPADRQPPPACPAVQVQLDRLELARPRSGALAGWPWNSGSSWSSTGSGRIACPPPAKGRAG